MEAALIDPEGDWPAHEPMALGQLWASWSEAPSSKTGEAEAPRYVRLHPSSSQALPVLRGGAVGPIAGQR